LLNLLRYFHSVPGRLRIKTDLLRRAATADAAQADIASLPGVNAATVNPTTGSLVITYDPTRLRTEAVWAKLCGLGLVSETPPSVGEGSLEQFSEVLSRQVMINLGAEIISRAVIALVV
jgi:hypothetical protein